MPHKTHLTQLQAVHCSALDHFCLPASNTNLHLCSFIGTPDKTFFAFLETKQRTRLAVRSSVCVIWCWWILSPHYALYGSNNVETAVKVFTANHHIRKIKSLFGTGSDCNVCTRHRGLFRPSQVLTRELSNPFSTYKIVSVALCKTTKNVISNYSK